jgi:hypothetical protein
LVRKVVAVDLFCCAQYRQCRDRQILPQLSVDDGLGANLVGKRHPFRVCEFTRDFHAPHRVIHGVLPAGPTPMMAQEFDGVNAPIPKSPTRQSHDQPGANAVVMNGHIDPKIC